MANEVGQSVMVTQSPSTLTKGVVMKPEVNAVLAEVKAQMNSMDNAISNPQPLSTMPDFKAMSIMEATKWCVEQGITSPSEISKTTGNKVGVISTALWKMRNPKRVKMLARRAKKIKDLKAGIVKEGVKATKPTKVKKPKIVNGLYDDGMETPWRDALQRRGVFPELQIPIETKTTTIHNELMAENRRLKILVEHYESILFKGGK
jgi:hypothetical protein